ncbi:hypothetical protein BDN72DRAFT_774606, partial [Pluteus cervinus]
MHHITWQSHVKKTDIPEYIQSHHCDACTQFVSVFSIPDTSFKYKEESKQSHYPPKPLSQTLVDKVITGFCRDASPSAFEECGCTVCGRLSCNATMTEARKVSGFFNNLENMSNTRLERKSLSKPILPISGPVLAKECSKVCLECRGQLLRNRQPKHALASDLWIGDVPPVLADLRFVEKLLIARIRVNSCIVRVSSGFHKMKAHVIAFENPVPKIYKKLPPAIEELDDVLAVLFTGPNRPTTSDYERVPLLVRRNKVIQALHWLKLNHKNYHDIDIDYKEIEKYPENQPPVVIQYKELNSNKFSEATSLFDQHELEDGVETGECPFTVHGLTGSNLQ